MDSLISVSCQLCASDSPIPLYKISGFKRDPRVFMVVKCGACSLVYINPRYSEKDNINLYKASYYTDQVVDLSGNVRSFFDDRESKINDHQIECNHLKNYKTGGKILDFGSGPGFFLGALEGSWEKYAVDISDFSINNIQDPAVNKFKGTLFEARFKDNYFDAIYIGHTLDRLTKVKETLTELKRILNPSGVILIVSPNIESLCAKVFRENYRLLYANHLVYFSPQILEEFCSQSGFRIASIRYPYFGTSFFSYFGFLFGTGKIFIQVLLNMFKIPLKMVSPPYRGNIMSVIISKS
jgi:ubiquinone/menaquinone biosynthesis C-methylase UbiE